MKLISPQFLKGAQSLLPYTAFEVNPTGIFEVRYMVHRLDWWSRNMSARGPKHAGLEKSALCQLW